MAKDTSGKKDKKKKGEEGSSPVKAVVEVDAGAVDVEMADESVEVKPKKAKKEKDEVMVPIEELSPIAQPLAQKKLVKKLHKTVKKATKQRQVKRGVKEVVKGIRKGQKGLLILAADISPIDIISHLPVLSEEANIPYVFVSSKDELGKASSTKRPTSCVLVCPDLKKKQKEGAVVEADDDYQELYDECFKEVKGLDEKIVF